MLIAEPAGLGRCCGTRSERQTGTTSLASDQLRRLDHVERWSIGTSLFLEAEGITLDAAWEDRRQVPRDRSGHVHIQGNDVRMLGRNRTVRIVLPVAAFLRIGGVRMLVVVVGMIGVIVMVLRASGTGEVVLVMGIPVVGMLYLKRQNRSDYLNEEKTGHQEAG